MSVKLFVYSLLGILIIGISNANAEIPFQDHTNYSSALLNDSTAPPYVLITISKTNTSESKTVCTSTNFLLGAIHKEYELGFSKAEVSKAYEIALSNTSHSFTFSKQEAIENIPVYYTFNDLSLIRKHLKQYSIAELKQGLSKHGMLIETVLHTPKIWENFENRHTWAIRDAFACALVERQLAVAKKDGSGGLYLYQEE